MEVRRLVGIRVKDEIHEAVVTDINYRPGKRGIVRVFSVPTQTYLEIEPDQIVSPIKQPRMFPRKLNVSVLTQFLNMEDPNKWLAHLLGLRLLRTPRLRLPSVAVAKQQRKRKTKRKTKTTMR
jgi:hypothetical protein